MGRGLGRSRDETLPRSQTLLPSRWKGKVGQTGDLGECSGGTAAGGGGSEVMAGPAGELGGLPGAAAGEGLGRSGGQGPAWPCSAASPATGSVWKGEREIQVSVVQGGQLLDTCQEGWACLLLPTVSSGHSQPLPDTGSSRERPSKGLRTLLRGNSCVAI